jgi:rubrerythrin
LTDLKHWLKFKQEPVGGKKFEPVVMITKNGFRSVYTQEREMNVYDFAMKMETDAEGLYRKLAQESNLEGLQRIFLEVAADENRHFHIFESFKVGSSAIEMGHSKALENSKNVFAGLLEHKETYGPFSNDLLEGYRYALKIEADLYKFYQDTAKKEQNENVKNALLKVAAEEEKHFNIVQNIYDFVNAPNQYLAWAEFSNIDEFQQFGRKVD